MPSSIPNSAINLLSDSIGFLDVGAYAIYLKANTNHSIRSDEFTADELRAIADHMDGNPQLKDLQANARRAWLNPASEDPPTIGDLVKCLTNVACNRLKRIHELEALLAASTQTIPARPVPTNHGNPIAV